MINTNEIAVFILIVFVRYVLNRRYSNFRIFVKHCVVVAVYIYIEPLQSGCAYFLSFSQPTMLNIHKVSYWWTHWSVRTWDCVRWQPEDFSNSAISFMQWTISVWEQKSLLLKAEGQWITDPLLSTPPPHIWHKLRTPEARLHRRGVSGLHTQKHTATHKRRGRERTWGLWSQV